MSNKAPIFFKLSPCFSVSLASPCLVLSSASQTEGQMQNLFHHVMFEGKNAVNYRLSFMHHLNLVEVSGSCSCSTMLFCAPFPNSLFSCFFFLAPLAFQPKKKKERTPPPTLFLPPMLFHVFFLSVFLLPVIKHIAVLQNEIKPVLCVSSWA